MLRSIVLSVLSASLIFAVGCSNKAKKGDDSEVGAVTSEPMSFNALGSDSGQINGLNTVHFDYDKSSLSATARKQLAENAEWLNKNPKSMLQIEGHCDSRGSVEYNLALGERRAKTVKNYLVSLGVASNRLKIISYGKEKPIVEGDSEQAFGKNRRANFLPLSN